MDLQDIDRIIQMAWEDRTPFEAILVQFGLQEKDVIELMRKELSAHAFRRWRRRVSGRKTKFKKLRSDEVNRFKCSRQKEVSHNRVT